MISLWRSAPFVRPVRRLLSVGGALSLALLLFLWLLLALRATPAHADTLCVKPGGGDGCLSTIGAALLAAQEDDTIRVAAGVYDENVIISQTVTLQGGWSPDFTSRDVDAYLSVILPADNTQSVVAIQGHFGDPAAVAPTFDGFVITGGRADLGSNHGGGLRIVDSNAAVISNTIQNNVAFFLGGGVWVQRGAPLLHGNEIVDNLSTGLGQDSYGGGIQLEDTQATLLGNVLARNVVSGTESFGGGLDISGTGVGQVTLQRNLFISNTALASPYAAPADEGLGGALAHRSGHVLLENGTFLSNTAANDGGAIYLLGDLIAAGNTISANTAFRGGGLFSAAQSVALSNTLFLSNTALGDGGGLLVGAGTAFSLTNSATIANHAGGDGGGIYNAGTIAISTTTVSGNSAAGMGGGIANIYLVELASTTVAANASSGGAGLFNASVVNAINSLIALNDGDNCLGALSSLGHNLEDGFTCGMGQPTDLPNTVPMLDPLADNGGVTPTHALDIASPAVDAADNAACAPADQRGTPRPLDGDGDGQAICDIGAFEFQRPTLYLPLLSGT